MPRVIGIDPGTVTIDLCGLDDGRVFLDQSLPTADALAHPSALVGLLDDAHRAAPLDLVAGPSGYGLPLTRARDLTEHDSGSRTSRPRAKLGRHRRPRVADADARALRAAGRVHAGRHPPRVGAGAPQGEPRRHGHGGQGVRGRARHSRAGRAARLPANGTSRSSCSSLAARLRRRLPSSAARIVDGAGGSSGPLGLRGAGALDGEVAFLAGSVSKGLLFGGGVAAIAGPPGCPGGGDRRSAATARRLAREAYLESAVKAVAALAVSVPDAHEVILSGRMARVAGVRDELARRLTGVVADASVHVLTGFAAVAKQAAQGAALAR